MGCGVLSLTPTHSLSLALSLSVSYLLSSVSGCVSIFTLQPLNFHVLYSLLSLDIIMTQVQQQTALMALITVYL